MVDPRDDASSDGAAVQTINVNYIKANSFREVSCDGVIGGPTPHHKIWIGFYSERPVVPQVVLHRLVPTDENSDEFRLDPKGTAVETRSGLIRNLEVGTYLSLEAAKELHQWLARQIADLEEFSRNG